MTDTSDDDDSQGSTWSQFSFTASGDEEKAAEPPALEPEPPVPLWRALAGSAGTKPRPLSKCARRPEDPISHAAFMSALGPASWSEAKALLGRVFVVQPFQAPKRELGFASTSVPGAVDVVTQRATAKSIFERLKKLAGAAASHKYSAAAVALATTGAAPSGLTGIEAELYEALGSALVVPAALLRDGGRKKAETAAPAEGKKPKKRPRPAAADSAAAAPPAEAPRPKRSRPAEEPAAARTTAAAPKPAPARSPAAVDPKPAPAGPKPAVAAGDSAACVQIVVPRTGTIRLELVAAP